MIFLQTYRTAVNNEDLDECMKRLAQGDANGLDLIYGKTKSAVFGYALSILKNYHDAEDVLQDCYVSVYVNAPAYSSENKPLAWILTIARNLCYKKLKYKDRAEYLDDKKAESIFSERSLFSVNSAEDRFFITECLNSLGKEEREMVLLHAVAGMKFREIAEFCDIPLPTALSKYNRAVKKIQKKYGSTEL